MVTFFLEDSAQEAFIPPLVSRLVEGEGLSLDEFEFSVLSARGGGSIRALKEYVRDVKRRKTAVPEALVVGVDGNCKGFADRRKQIEGIAGAEIFPAVVTAVPDPHVERWYLLDAPALSNAVGVPVAPVPPKAKCEKGHYKKLLRDTFAESGVTPPLGGIEYGPDVARDIDLYEAGKLDPALQDFVDRARAWLKIISR